MKPVPEAKSVAIAVAVLSHASSLGHFRDQLSDKGREKETSGQRAMSAGTAQLVGGGGGCFAVRVEAIHIFQK